MRKVNFAGADNAHAATDDATESGRLIGQYIHVRNRAASAARSDDHLDHSLPATAAETPRVYKANIRNSRSTDTS